MNQEHPNIEVLKKFNPMNIADSIDVLAKNAVFHFINPGLPKVQGDYVGYEGIQTFFDTMGQLSHGTFRTDPISVQPMGDELVVAHTISSMVLEGHHMETDAVVVWRIVDGKITEVWDIPSIHHLQVVR